MLADRSASPPRSTLRPSSNDIRTSGGGAASGDHWYVAQTEPRAEDRAIAHLERQGYQVFCPRYRKTVRHARNARQILAPLFPNYLFLHLDTSRDLWRAVNGTRGVMRLISQGEAPAPLPHGIVGDLLSKADAQRPDGLDPHIQDRPGRSDCRRAVRRFRR